MFVPQIVGGLAPPGLVTLNVSVMHLVKSQTGIVPPLATTPVRAILLVTVTVPVLGPEMTKMSKSSLSWKFF